MTTHSPTRPLPNKQGLVDRLLAVERLISRPLRTQPRRMKPIEIALLYYFAYHCGPNLQDGGWRISQGQLATMFGKVRQVIARAIKVLKDEGLLEAIPHQHASIYRMGPNFLFQCKPTVTLEHPLTVTPELHPTVTPQLHPQAHTFNEQDNKNDYADAREGATGPQLGYLKSLLKDKGFEWEDVRAAWPDAPTRPWGLTKAMASQLITWLKRQADGSYEEEIRWEDIPVVRDSMAAIVERSNGHGD